MNGEHKAGSGATPSVLLTETAMRAALHVGERKFAQLKAAGIVPPPIELGPRCARWTQQDLAEIISRLPRRDRQAEPQRLAQGRRQRIEKLKAGGEVQA